ncbi:MAG: L-histidine N(alpha)-methyltransferase [Verrucomicrobiota bacterium]|nr:L-histidine N(alpha)-methyltransferase [Verrucomicrobiota bacterium]MEC9330915.1 L-histidine N(alpha)-methyltransferase [Verrucomicrobiota bacterium]
MSSSHTNSVKVTIHPSQFPDVIQRQLIAALRNSCVPPKFLYDSVYQTQKWLNVHQVHSPSRIDSDVTRIYDSVFDVEFAQAKYSEVALIGLGCGGGQKDARCISKLKLATSLLHYVPCDVSQSMTLVARKEVGKKLNYNNVYPLVCDLSESDNLDQLLDDLLPFRHKRIFTFFGMIPNFEPDLIFPKLFRITRDDDKLFISANLVSGDNYQVGVESILSQYDNEETRDWLLSFLVGLGIPMHAGGLFFGIESAGGLLRIVADFRFIHSQVIHIDGEIITFESGQSLRLFYSYRHTEETLNKCLYNHGLKIVCCEISKSGEEGVFVVKRAV